MSNRFKSGDLVWVRNFNWQDWEEAVFLASDDGAGCAARNLNGVLNPYLQCRGIPSDIELQFREGDHVQVREEYEDVWHDATFRRTVTRSYPHVYVVCVRGEIDFTYWPKCRINKDFKK
jgi:hypothetical protein